MYCSLSLGQFEGDGGSKLYIINQLKQKIYEAECKRISLEEISDATIKKLKRERTDLMNVIQLCEHGCTIPPNISKPTGETRISYVLMIESLICRLLPALLCNCSLELKHLNSEVYFQEFVSLHFALFVIACLLRSCYDKGSFIQNSTLFSISLGLSKIFWSNNIITVVLLIIVEKGRLFNWRREINELFWFEHIYFRIYGGWTNLCFNLWSYKWYRYTISTRNT